MTVRTRFAPSPTGFLHLGGARTALFCWLYARRFSGQFILRIEDTDLERSNSELVQAILDGMEWLELDWDEGPFYQMERIDRYREIIAQLLAEGNAYKCYCSKERLIDLREKQMAVKEKPRYDGLCRMQDPKDSDQPYVIRFKNPQEGSVTFDDQVHGTITFQNSELDDLIIARSDGTPTYNLTVVVDDMDMNITHVIRGADHINNTPRQINLLKALGAELPIYAHVPMILGPDGKKLSKRRNAVSIMQYHDFGYLPDALLNYLVRLGWSHGDQEIFSREEMIKCFDIKDVNKAPTIFDFDKLNWLNQHYMKTEDPEKVAPYLQHQMDLLGIDISSGPMLTEIVKVQAERCHTLKEMAEKSIYFYRDVTVYEEKAQKHLKLEAAVILEAVKEGVANLTDWTAESIHQVVIAVAEKLELKLGKVAQLVRVAVTGGTVSPPIDVTLELLGRECVLERLQRAIAFCEE